MQRLKKPPVTEPPSRVTKSVLTVGPVVPIDRTVPAVLIGIVDVGGFDFAHTDFLTTDGTQKTRFVSIWDQGAPKGSPLGPPPAPFTD